MRVGLVFPANDLGHNGVLQTWWMVDSFVLEENKDFKWTVVTALWLNMGPMPNWHKEPRRFIFNRRKKTEG